MKNLKKQRRMLGLNQFELARLAGLAPWKIVFAETNRIKLTSGELDQIKAALARRAEEVAAAVA
jgi:predicted transcriptional regulator